MSRCSGLHIQRVREKEIIICEIEIEIGTTASKWKHMLNLRWIFRVTIIYLLKQWTDLIWFETTFEATIKTYGVIHWAEKYRFKIEKLIISRLERMSTIRVKANSMEMRRTTAVLRVPSSAWIESYFTWNMDEGNEHLKITNKITYKSNAKYWGQKLSQIKKQLLFWKMAIQSLFICESFNHLNWIYTFAQYWPWKIGSSY